MTKQIKFVYNTGNETPWYNEECAMKNWNKLPLHVQEGKFKAVIVKEEMTKTEYEKKFK